MITPTKIVQHLKTYLPLFTDRFTDSITIISATISGGNLITVNAVAHGLTLNKKIVLSAGTVRNPLIDSSLNSDGTVRFETEFEHDLIEPSQPLDQQNLEFANFGNVWDGEHAIDSVPNRKNIEVELPSGEIAAPPVDGSQYLIETRKAGFFGLQTVNSVVDADNFTILISGAPSFPNGPVDGLNIITGYRIAAAADIERAQAAYSRKFEDPDFDAQNYLFVIMADVDTSKDRHTTNDAVAGFTNQDTMLLRILQNFSTTIFIPTKDEISGSDAQDLAYGEIYNALLSTLYGFGENDGAIQYVTATTGHGPGIYNSAYYTHVYDWQNPTAITYENGFIDNQDVAFRDIVGDFKLFNDQEAIMSVGIDLDDEPLP